MDNSPEFLEKILQGRDLGSQEMSELMRGIMSGSLSQAMIAAFLAAMRAKDITAEELSSAAKVMRDFSIKVEVADKEHLLDTCGSGGDGANTFNISTASALVAAAGGAKVAKHGNKAVSSCSGSADLLSAAGVKLELRPEQISQAINKFGFGFIFAPLHHSAMKHVAPVRQELKVRTMFNMLGPLTNPAGCLCQLIGIFSKEYLRLYAETLKQLGSSRVLVVHSADGLDEISPADKTYCAELKDGKIKEYEISPESFGVETYKLEDIKSNSLEASLIKVKDGLAGKDKAAAATIALNSGAAFYIVGISDSIKDGVDLAWEIIDQGAAGKKLKEYTTWSQASN